ncbi:hypothetical protein ACHAW5_003763 [Stephanodiscus triporus]|uniref:HIG1 domain-containing protein n=1 Tax=Stephanodiscus triporus TaxID=2934178 RepID=A0ABD3PBI8_9STRA
MGTQHSTRSTTACETSPSRGGESSSFEPGGVVDPLLTSKNAFSPIVPPSPMPQLMRPETFEEKLYRKFKAEPLVPIGCLVTAYFLGSGIHSFYNRDPKKSQKMMRLRVGSQFMTIVIFVGYAGMNAFTLEFAPGMASPSDQFPGAGKGGGDRGKG